jgi:hypothetical protein
MDAVGCFWFWPAAVLFAGPLVVVALVGLATVAEPINNAAALAANSGAVIFTP